MQTRLKNRWFPAGLATVALSAILAGGGTGSVRISPAMPRYPIWHPSNSKHSNQRINSRSLFGRLPMNCCRLSSRLRTAPNWLGKPRVHQAQSHRLTQCRGKIHSRALPLKTCFVATSFKCHPMVQMDHPCHHRVEELARA